MNKLTITNLQKLEGKTVTITIPTPHQPIEVSIAINDTVMGRTYYELMNRSYRGYIGLIIYRDILDGDLVRVSFSTTHYCFVSVSDMITVDPFLDILSSKRWIQH